MQISLEKGGFKSSQICITITSRQRIREKKLLEEFLILLNAPMLQKHTGIYTCRMR